jgi:hypothetical protein
MGIDSGVVTIVFPQTGKGKQLKKRWQPYASNNSECHRLGFHLFENLKRRATSYTNLSTSNKARRSPNKARRSPRFRLGSRRSNSSNFSPDLARPLVLAQPYVDRVAQEVVSRPGQVRNFGDKLRLDPMNAR